jgi:signal peptidase II
VQENHDARGVSFLNKQIYWLLIPVTLLVVLDEWLKYQALERLPLEGSLVDPELLSFAIHKNWGIAFDIPFRLELVILISLIIGYELIKTAVKHWQNRPFISFSALMIIAGACGNLYDRITYGFTVDYIILFGRSAINLSDVIIVLGVILLFLSSQKKNASTPIHSNNNL